MGRPDSGMKQAIAACLDAGLTVKEAAAALDISFATANIYAWAHTRPEQYAAWRRRTDGYAAEKRQARLECEAQQAPPFWTMARLKKVKELREGKHSLSQCAAIIGHGCTRNMVAGICNRMGWKTGRNPAHIRELVRDGLARGMTGAQIAAFYDVRLGTAQSYAWRLRYPDRAQAYEERRAKLAKEIYHARKSVRGA